VHQWYPAPRLGRNPFPATWLVSIATGYSGWTNYQTRTVGLDLDGNDNGEGTYRAART
jgi:hypothetical protein